MTIMDDVLNQWTAAAKAGLGIDLDIDRSLLLALAGDAAHSVVRPAAPLNDVLGRVCGGACGRWS